MSDSQDLEDLCKKAVRSISDAKALGFHSTEVSISDENLANKLCGYIEQTYPLTYSRLKGAIEISWP
jgi:hypothetical protein